MLKRFYQERLQRNNILLLYELYYLLLTKN